MENKFLDKVKIISKELYKIKKVIPGINSFEDFINLYVTTK